MKILSISFLLFLLVFTVSFANKKEGQGDEPYIPPLTVYIK